MSGQKGRSGRRSLSVEVERSKIRDLAWQRTGELMSDESVIKHGLPKVVAIAAAPLVKADMTKPTVVVDNSTHEHKTYVKFDGFNPVQLTDFLLGRNGYTAQPS